MENKLENEIESNIEKEELPDLKKKISYTYWVDEHNKSRELPADQRPVKIENATSIPAKVAESGRSQWNSSGTWEQRKILIKEIESNFHDLLIEWIAAKEFKLKLKKISLDGECETIFSRNKRSLVYEVKGSIQFESEGKNCKIVLEDLTDHGDQQYSVKADKAEERAILGKDALTMVKILETVLQRYKE